MFSPKKELEPTKIRLPRRNSLPDIAFLSELLSAASDKKGQDVEVSWSESETSSIFSLVVRMEGKEEDLPQWVLWEDDGQQSRLAWRYESYDLEFVHDMLYMCRSATAAPDTAAFGELDQGSPPSLKRTDSEKDHPGGQIAASVAPANQAEKSERSALSHQFVGTPADVVLRVIARASQPLFNSLADNLRLGSETCIEGSFERIEISTLLQALAIAQVAGKLAVTRGDSIGCIYFNRGII